MSTETNKKIVTRFNMEFIEAGNEKVYRELVDPSFINRTAPAGAQTAEASFQFIQNVLRSAIQNLKVTIHTQVAENDLVVTHKTFTGIHVQDFAGIKPSHREVKIHIMDIIRLKDDKYVEHWSVRDMQDVISESLKASS